MSKIEDIRKINPETKIMTLADAKFRKYGKIHSTLQLSKLFEAAEKNIPLLSEGGKYEASLPVLEALTAEKNMIRYSVYGGLPVEIGYCVGQNTKMNGMEWHQGSELILAITDMIVLLAPITSIYEKDGKFTMSSEEVETFYIEKGTTVELYGGVLHFCPVKTDTAGFLNIVVLPEGTNTPIPEDAKKYFNDPTLMQNNKWLITHPEAQFGYQCITGKNITINI
jgi:hypothetical protein